MSQLTQFKTDDGIEVIINQETGEAFASAAGYSRMSGAKKTTISKRLKGLNPTERNRGEVQTPGGIQGVELIPASLCFKWAIKDNPGLAEKMGEVGATVFLHKLAGYEVTSTATSQPSVDRDLPDNLKALQLLLDNAAEVHRKQQELERRQQELETQQREQSLAVTEILEDKRIATEQLKALPAPTVEAPQMTMRAKVNQLVRNYVGRTNIPHREVWNRLYKEFFYRCSYNAGERAKNRGLKKLDCIEQDGLMEQFYAIGCDVLAV